MPQERTQSTIIYNLDLSRAPYVLYGVHNIDPAILPRFAGHKNALVEDCEISYTGDDLYAVWPQVMWDINIYLKYLVNGNATL